MKGNEITTLIKYFYICLGQHAFSFTAKPLIYTISVLSLMLAGIIFYPTQYESIYKEENCRDTDKEYNITLKSKHFSFKNFGGK